jgi:tRNA(His) guanylyltransferase
MSDKTALGDRMKWYESRYTNDQFMPMAPVIARLDGRAFHSFTKGLKRPYDEQLSNLMIMTTQFLVQETNARCGYTQSDEITLVWLAEDWESEIFFAGKLQKMNSILSSMTTAFFNRHLASFLPDKKDQLPLFDCRVFQVPTEFEAVNCFIWREQDATRNSVQMAARSIFSHKECENKDGSELQEMLWQRGINWNDYPPFFKRGTYVRRRVVEREFTKEELESLPEKHAARRHPDLKIKRTVVMREDFPPVVKMANREEVILHGADPIMRIEDNAT